MTMFAKFRIHHIYLLLPLLLAVGTSGCYKSADNKTIPKVRIASGPPLAWGVGAGTEADEYIGKSKSNVYVVHAGDTLWAIAAVHGVELEKLAKWNNIENSDELRIGQKLQLVAPKKVKITEKPVVVKKAEVIAESIVPDKQLQLAKNIKKIKIADKPFVKIEQPIRQKAITMAKIAKPQKKEVAKKPIKVEKAKKRVAAKKSKFKTWKLPKYPPKKWSWPHKGKIINRFGRRGQQRNNGIDIAVRVGDPVRAAADGIVAYADSGLPGYGKMILLRHGGSYMTAYGYINQILVRRGQPIKAGERIALAGQSGHATTPRLHFEIRQRVKPLNPLTRLPKKK
ncbi:MAG: peptidoglycan DD-metalloendopeptidase family protein [Magnetococcales bacterium]|nr:peptidoglycan DD-metalloendopeptidase family protein [Magnetococcales bacterium]